MSGFESIKEKLILRKKELENTLTVLSREKVSEDQVLDTGDQASLSNLEGLKKSLHDNELEEYKMILKSIEMIDKGTYGICITCGKKISERRLTLIPNATRCILCQEALEESQVD